MSASTRLPCLDCGANTSGARDRNDAIGEYYHVHEEVWFAAFDHLWEPEMTWAHKEPIIKAGFLCIGCLEVRLGRELTPDDFSDAPVNHPSWSRKSERLLARMGDDVPRRCLARMAGSL